jgi:alkanesulfonate monooxygenase SsuD/methylene tetrahydromethanopterin reductase-like flavin-dependent oxidoreductase (luciferase family)
MEFGMFFELQLPRPWHDTDEQTLFQNALEWAELGEAAGIRYAWAQEHHFLEEYSHSTAPEVFLAAVSQRTKHMRLGHGVTLMLPQYNHPARVAERIATLDLVSNGRVEWGTGESSSRVELEGFGVEYIKKRATWAECVQEAAKMMAATPYPGHQGRSFSMPARNIVPKPVQRPHPPLWVACTNRDTMKLAARLGMGALTFAFMDASEAKHWVDEYYETFKHECVPIGQAVNPNIAMLAGVCLDEDRDLALTKGIEGQQFFKWGLAWYYRFGVHVPGRTNLWDEFQRAEREPMAGVSAVGDPQAVVRHFRELEAAGVDQVIMLQQAGRYRNEDICHTLDLLGRDVIPQFAEREPERQRRKRQQLAPYIEKALGRRDMIDVVDPEPVEAYPVTWAKDAGGTNVGPRRSLDAPPLWRLNVSGAGPRTTR